MERVREGGRERAWGDRERNTMGGSAVRESGRRKARKRWVRDGATGGNRVGGVAAAALGRMRRCDSALLIVSDKYYIYI